MSNNTKKGNNYERGLVPDVLSFSYIAFMLSVFLVYMDDMYFNITHTRQATFVKGSLVFIAFSVVGYALEIYMMGYFDKKSSIIDTLKSGDKHIISLPEISIILFFFANLAAFFNAPDKKAAWTGENGRFFGLEIITVIALMFIFLARRCCIKEIHFYIFLIVAAVASFMACLQHFGYDPFLLREKIIGKQKELFISLFGNLNTYGSFLAMAIPGAAAVFIFSKKMINTFLAGFGLFVIAVGIIPAKSDNVYLGAGAAMMVVLYLAIYYKKTFRFMQSVTITFAGLLLMAFMNYKWSGSQKHINGLAVIIESPKIMLVLFAVSVPAAIITHVIGKKIGDKLQKSDIKKILLIMTFVILALGIIVVCEGVKRKISFFVFDDNWGTFRGYIWRRSVSLFEMATPRQKIFGYGNETIRSLMVSNFNEEMVSITNKTYDNCHNELLQYLVTTGLFGMISYIMLFISGVIYMIRKCDGDCIAIAILAAFIGYAVQGTVYLNQPITSPLYFVLIAAGIGYVRRQTPKILS